MNRKQFCSCSLAAMLGLTGLGSPARAAETSKPTQSAMAETLAPHWRQLLTVMNIQLDEATWQRILQENGHLCHQQLIAGRSFKTITLEEWITFLQLQMGQDTCQTKEGKLILLWRRPAATEKKCLCPLALQAPPEMHGRWCQCSCGHVADFLRTYTGIIGQVEVLESFNRGGACCRFQITLPQQYRAGI